jgi:hypothetical protein
MACELLAHDDWRAKRLLNAALDFSLNATGVWDTSTTAAVKSVVCRARRPAVCRQLTPRVRVAWLGRKFQGRAGLRTNGIMDSATWPQLVANVTPPREGDAGDVVLAAQEALAATGAAAPPLDGRYDAVMVAAIATFQAQRGVVPSNGSVVDHRTWHLLASDCNSSAAAQFWFDAGWPQACARAAARAVHRRPSPRGAQGNLSLEVLTCLRGTGFRFATFECWRQYTGFFAPCMDNVRRAWAAGFESVGVYMFPIRAADPQKQARRRERACERVSGVLS